MCVCVCGEEMHPTGNALLINFLLSSDADVLISNRRPSMQIGAQTCKNACAMCITFRVIFHFACQHWWLGMPFKKEKEEEGEEEEEEEEEERGKNHQAPFSKPNHASNPSSSLPFGRNFNHFLSPQMGDGNEKGERRRFLKFELCLCFFLKKERGNSVTKTQIDINCFVSFLNKKREKN